LSDLDNSNAEVLFFYPTLMSQFRLRGPLTLLSAQELEAHWQHKPYEAKLLDHFYTELHSQSASIAGRKVLDEGIADLKLRYPNPSGVPFIEDALGLVVTANYLEIWQASDSGIHDRRLYTRSESEWQEAVLVP
jgi:pyridoxine/pyridoxamine 5'-phosphate oxidase